MLPQIQFTDHMFADHIDIQSVRVFLAVATDSAYRSHAELFVEAFVPTEMGATVKYVIENSPTRKISHAESCMR